MDSLNYHHLRYFWTVAKEGSLSRAAAKLHVSQPSISEQIHELELSFGVKLFQREGRRNVLTDAGQIAFGYADQIFALGRELSNAVTQAPGAKMLRLYVGVTDSLPKLVTNEILRPVFSMSETIHVICREGKMDDLLEQLTAHRLDIVLSDEPASTSTRFKTFNHPLGGTGTIFCAEKKLGARLRRGFPDSLHDAPALLPAENTSLRRALDTWFRDRNIQPRVVAEFEDLALMKVMAAEGRGFIAVPGVSHEDAIAHYGYEIVGKADTCRIHFHAITAERHIEHPAVSLITSKARVMLQG